MKIQYVKANFYCSYKILFNVFRSACKPYLANEAACVIGA